MKIPIKFHTLSQTKLKFFASLQSKKIREKEALFLIEGKKLVEEALSECIEIKALIVTNQEIIKELDIHPALDCYLAKPEEFKKISSLENPEGILAVASCFKKRELSIQKNHKYFILDQIQDPGNLGTILRICDAFDIQGVILHQCVEIYNPKVVRASMGAIFRVPFYEMVDIQTFIEKNHHKMIKSDLQGKSLKDIQLTDFQFIVLGNEANGLISEWTQKIKHSLCIPQKGKAESLNVAVAGAILAWEWTK
jgi:TrmH family RNA methyltransferase